LDPAHESWNTISVGTSPGSKSPRYRKAGALISAALLLPRPASAADRPIIEIACERLDGEDADELVARLQLALLPDAGSAVPRRLRVECNLATASLRFDDEDWQPVDEDGGLIEGIIDLVERRLREDQAPASLAIIDAGAKAATVVSDEDPPPYVLDSSALEPDGHGEANPSVFGAPAPGGLGIGVSSEAWSGLGYGVGPRLDVAIGIESMSILISEAMLFDTGSVNAASVADLELGVGWGAPHAARSRFGLVLLGGVEMFSIATPDRKHTVGPKLAPILDAGVRLAQPLGSAVVWLGVDARLRPDPAAADDPFNVRLPLVSAVFSLGMLMHAPSSESRKSR
jgi:hypothetical protein